MTLEVYKRLLAAAETCSATDPAWRRTVAIARLAGSAGVLDLDPLIDDPAVDAEQAYARLLAMAPTQQAINGLLATRRLLELEATNVH